MNVKVDRLTSTLYQADCIDCPGSPPVGYGATEAEAVLALVHGLIGRPERWEQYFAVTPTLNGKPVIQQPFRPR
jgi:hypothetical protein